MNISMLKALFINIIKRRKMMKKRDYKFCGCWEVRGVRDAWLDMFSKEIKKNGEKSGEVYELINAIKEMNKEGVLDEISDMCWGVGRLVGGLVGRKYVRVFGDRRHYEKVKERYEECGCIRSKNNKSYCGRK